MNFGTMWGRSTGAAFKGGVLVLFVATTAWAQQGGTQNDQGTRLNGSAGELYERIGIPLASATTLQGVGIKVSLVEGKLEQTDGSLKGTAFKDVTFTTTNSQNQQVTFTIKSAARHTNVYTGKLSNTAWEYQVTWTSPNGSGDLCRDGRPALALPGYWEERTFVPSNNPAKFSFACVPIKTQNANGTFWYAKGGVAAKCVDWGYPPWLNKDALPGNGVYPATTLDQALRYHVSCVAMASADYCGEARSNTVDGTPIVMFNTQNVQNGKDGMGNPTPYVAAGPFGSGGKFLFEAAWAAVRAPVRDTTAVSGGLRPKALCLTKKRWSTLPLNGACASDASFVQDPRDPITRPNPPRFCEDMSRGELQAAGALLFSYSAYIDAGLYRFVNSNTGAYLTTSRVEIGASGRYASYRPDSSIPGAADFLPDIGANRPPFYEGPLFSTNAPFAVPALKDTLPLRRYTSTQPDGKRRYVTLVEGSQVPPGYASDGSNNLEGYIYVRPPPAGAPVLRLWRKDVGPGLLTTTSSMWPGYIIAPWQAAPMGSLPSMNTYSGLY
ncbi:ADYC domain-containing protein [Archangium lipolyticum]|uniref:ADYC domain-containing protein n=1 Tax=Archangium lipolyticum TaxID=2970465 RepID=UPI002149F6AA|nr:ADYC domain-containing protein [Archangium lipolyticum]